MKHFILILLCVLSFNCSTSQQFTATETSSSIKKTSNKSKLVIGIVVDQMRYDYLTRFYNKFSEGGFKRLITKGYNLKNTHYNYTPTYTGPGHASIFTGATPSTHAIISNYWYNKYLNETVYCVQDDSVSSVGTSHKAGKMSPRRMKTTTFADENRLFTQFKGKTIGISLKDRGAVLPAGHTANAAYWFHGKDEGAFITSNFYTNELPNWVKKFNASNTAKSYLKTWTTSFPIETYTESGKDLNTFETGFKGQENAVFPYDIEKLSSKNDGYNILKATPFGNSLLVDFALDAIKNEALGQDEFTDVLTLSFSSTDYVGHNFGVNSKELEDTYIKLDLDLQRFFSELDKQVGVGDYTIFLTSDHGAIEVPAYLQENKIPSGYASFSKIEDKLNDDLEKHYKVSGLVRNVSNNQVFLDNEIVLNTKLNLTEVQEKVVLLLMDQPLVYKAFSASTLQKSEFSKGIESLIQNGYNQKFSGDVMFDLDPAYISYPKTGSTHGSGLNYDTHVPLLFYGNGIKMGSSFKKVEITSIAPTISALLGISFPNGSSQNVLDFILKTD